ncbi:MAG: DUF397 domain-containing protein [Actinomadura sp.]
MTRRRSSRSGPNGEQYAEVGRVPGSRRIAAGDGREPTGPRLRFDRPEWQGLIESIKTSRYALR